jgi:hypothetical protein
LGHQPEQTVSNEAELSRKSTWITSINV